MPKNLASKASTPSMKAPWRGYLAIGRLSPGRLEDQTKRLEEMAVGHGNPTQLFDFQNESNGLQVLSTHPMSLEILKSRTYCLGGHFQHSLHFVLIYLEKRCPATACEALEGTCPIDKCKKSSYEMSSLKLNTPSLIGPQLPNLLV